VTFERPLLLLTLLVVPLAVLLYVLSERRRMRYAIRFTNLEVLAGVIGGGYRRRFVPLALFFLALAALCIGMARPQHKTLVARDRATVILVVDVSRSMEAKDVKPSRIGAATAAVRTRSASGRTDRLCGRSRGGDAADDESRSRPEVPADHRMVPQLRRHGHRRRSRRRREARPAGGDGGQWQPRLEHDRSARHADARARLDPLSVRWGADARPARAERRSRSRQGGGDSRLHRRARHSERHAHLRRRQRPLQWTAGAGPAGSRDAQGHRRPHRRAILRRTEREVVAVGVLEARLKPRTHCCWSQRGFCPRSGRLGCPRRSPGAVRRRCACSRSAFRRVPVPGTGTQRSPKSDEGHECAASHADVPVPGTGTQP